MVRIFRLLFPSVFSLLALPCLAVNTADTRMLTDPAVSEHQIAFSYDGDLWIAERGTGPLVARRLTSQPGDEQNPRFSPDGSLLAFSANYDGNLDVYVTPATGGAPQRLTWHPSSDIVLGFTPDGSAILFQSSRVSFSRRHRQLFTIPTAGGFPTQLPLPHGWKASYSPDGTKLAYQPQRDAHTQWKNYRGGTMARLWIYDIAGHGVIEVPKPDGGANDTEPMWIDERLYFRSDRDGEFNLYRFAPKTNTVERLTSHKDFPVLRASAGAGVVIYEQAGYLHLYNPTTASSQRLVIGAAAELRETRPRYVGGMDYLRNASISPSGARAVLELRGEIVTVPAEKGDPRNLTRSSGAHERSPIWSPDGRSIAWFSEASGEYELHVAPATGEGESRAYPVDGAGFYFDPKWSPDGTKISFVDNSHAVLWLDLDAGTTHEAGRNPIYGPASDPQHAWSPDSRWLATTLITVTYINQISLHDVTTGTSYPVSDALSDVTEPAFDRNGKYLYFLGSTDAGPSRTWFALSSADTEISHHLYLAVLPSGEPSPLAPQSDEEKPGDEASLSKDRKQGAKKDTGKETGKEPPSVLIDFENLDQRILHIPADAGFLHRLQAGKEGQIFYLRSAPTGALNGDGANALVRFDLEKREETTLHKNVADFKISADGEKILAITPKKLLLGKANGDKLRGKALDIDAAQLRIDPRAEWRQIFHEVWRINRDYFYDPGMHGADWPALREKYAAFLPHLSTRNDLERLLRWMCSELGVGHHRTGGGDRLEEPHRIPGGLLGADFEVHEGRYRFAKVLGGLNWNPDLRAPLTEPGIDVKAGEYLLAVRGEELRAPDNLYRLFENTAEKGVEITIGPYPDGREARTVKVVPLSGEWSLRNRDWVEGNLRRVHEATAGRVAYVWLPDTGGGGHSYFKRYFFPQADKEAIIVDERMNGGGLIADYFIDILRRPYTSHWATRYGADLESPVGAIQGPKVMLIDETAGSGGDLLPWMFRRFKLGPLIGKTTWGGLVGILGFPVLMDGSGVTAPNIAFWTEDEGFGIENVGVRPDIEVEMLPSEVMQGLDPQLEKAIEVLLEKLENNPPKTYQKPPFPVRVRQPSQVEKQRHPPRAKQ
jgi:tricorn protease